MARRGAGSGGVAAGPPAGAWSGFHRLSPHARLARVAAHAGLTPAETAALRAASGLPRKRAEAFIENAVGAFPLPLAFAVNFIVDGRDVVVPMAIEESSVVAAASHGAKMAAAGGGFVTTADPPVALGQVEIRCDAADADAILRHIQQHARRTIARLNALIPGMVGRGGGVTELEAYRVAGRIVVLLHIDVRDAMGANVVNAVCEAAWDALDVPAGRAGLRILTNHSPSLRRASARCRVPFAAVGGEAVARAIVEAWEFSQVDVFRAVTHNKGLMNGIDAVLVATGNDWRAVEAGVHAFAARAPPYRGLGHYALDDGALVAALELPLAVGTVGGVTRLHPVAAACLRVLGAEHGPDLARILAAVGLAQNLAALRALAAEGIQAGHMRLHAANRRLWEQTDEGGRADVGRPTADGAQRADGLQPADREPAGAKRADVRRRKPKSR